MKLYNYVGALCISAAALSLTSCESFLDRPAEDSYNTSNFYLNDEQCYQGVNFLYNSPWYDFQRGFIKVGEVLSGNIYMGNSPYLTFTVKGTDTDLVNMSCALWAVIGHTSVVYDNLMASPASQEAKNACMGECLTWRAMAYFYLVRTFGDIPIVHNLSNELNGNYNDKKKVLSADVYEYIVMTLEKAMELLPKSASKGRIDYYCAEALLAKVYLTKAGLGQTMTRNIDDLNAAARYAKDVIDSSGRNLLPEYSDVFRLVNNESEESLIAWRWTSSGEAWTRQNSLQSDLAPVGFDEYGDCWGGYTGPSVDLEDAFGFDVLADPANRLDNDSRRKATLMTAGDKYEYFWTDKGGFDVLRFVYETDGYGKGGPATWQSNTGAFNVKHLYGNANDHQQALGVAADKMASGLATHLLRLSDVYLIYAEAVLGNSESTSDASALAAFNAVRSRANHTATPLTSITFDDVWKERRLELACEGDRWYDYVRLAYYDPDRAIDEIKNQRRNCYWNVNELFKYYYENGVWDIQKAASSANAGEATYDEYTPAPNVTRESFKLPFPTDDVVYNPNLLEAAEHVDIRATYSY